MKKGMLVLFFGLLFIVYSCSDNGVSSTEDSITGEWISVDFEGDTTYMTITTADYIVFKKVIQPYIYLDTFYILEKENLDNNLLYLFTKYTDGYINTDENTTYFSSQYYTLGKIGFWVEKLAEDTILLHYSEIYKKVGENAYSINRKYYDDINEDTVFVRDTIYFLSSDTGFVSMTTTDPLIDDVKREMKIVNNQIWLVNPDYYMGTIYKKDKFLYLVYDQGARIPENNMYIFYKKH